MVRIVDWVLGWLLDTPSHKIRFVYIPLAVFGIIVAVLALVDTDISLIRSLGW